MEIVLFVQSIYFVVTALWPLVSMRTFEAVSGPKTDHWLVKIVATLLLVIGGVLFLAASHHHVSLEIKLLALASCVGLALADIVFVSEKRISRVYLLDAVAELILALGLTLCWNR